MLKRARLCLKVHILESVSGLLPQKVKREADSHTGYTSFASLSITERSDACERLEVGGDAWSRRSLGKGGSWTIRGGEDPAIAGLVRRPRPASNRYFNK